MFDLSGKGALITGASRGIGRAIAAVLDVAAMFVVALSRLGRGAYAEILTADEPPASEEEIVIVGQVAAG